VIGTALELAMGVTAGLGEHSAVLGLALEISAGLLERTAGDPSVGTLGWEHGTALGLTLDLTAGPLGCGFGGHGFGWGCIG
jgi:hypothetical protein